MAAKSCHWHNLYWAVFVLLMHPTMSCPTYDGMMPGLRRYLLPCGDPYRPKFVGHKMTTCSPPWPSHQLTLTPLGIRRNMSRVAHNPGTTAAGMQCMLTICACTWACTSPRVPPPGSAMARTCCATALHVYGQSAKHETWLDPASA